MTKQTLTDDPLKLERPKMPSELYFMYDDGKAISGKEEAKIKCEFSKYPGTERIPELIDQPSTKGKLRNPYV